MDIQQTVDGDKEEMKKKSILAILMAGLMLATVFSALSVSAASYSSYSQEQLQAGTGIATLKVLVYKDYNDNGKQDEGERGTGGAWVSILYLGVSFRIVKRTTSAAGLATFTLIISPCEDFGLVFKVSAVSGNWIGVYGYGGDSWSLIVHRGETKTISIGLIETESISEPSQIGPDLNLR